MYAKFLLNACIIGIILAVVVDLSRAGNLSGGALAVCAVLAVFLETLRGFFGNGGTS